MKNTANNSCNIIIEKLLKNIQDLEVYCFSGKTRLFRRIQNNGTKNVSVYDDKFRNINLKFLEEDVITNIPFDKLIKQSIVLSEKLAKDFYFVRVDWLISDDKLYFNELTFTPFSGFCNIDKKWNKKLGKLINL